MISHVIDGVLLLALVLTSLRVGAVYRELKRLRSYQTQYFEVFDETSRAADGIGAAIRHLGGDGVDVLQRLEAAIASGNDLAERLDALNRAAASASPASEDIGLYSRRDAGRPAGGGDARHDTELQRFKSEMLKLTADSRALQDRRGDATGGAVAPPHSQTREFRLAPSVRTVRAAGGNG